VAWSYPVNLRPLAGYLVPNCLVGTCVNTTKLVPVLSYFQDHIYTCFIPVTNQSWTQYQDRTGDLVPNQYWPVLFKRTSGLGVDTNDYYLLHSPASFSPLLQSFKPCDCRISFQKLLCLAQKPSLVSCTHYILPTNWILYRCKVFQQIKTEDCVNMEFYN
jgi:hypothetical protein